MTAPAKPFVPWGPQAPPIDPEETRLRMSAQSILSGPELGQCPPLTLRQALDVLAWHRNVAPLRAQGCTEPRSESEQYAAEQRGPDQDDNTQDEG